MCLYVSEDVGWGTAPREAKKRGELAHRMPFHMPDRNHENIVQKTVHEGIVYCASSVNEALYQKLILLKQIEGSKQCLTTNSHYWEKVEPGFKPSSHWLLRPCCLITDTSSLKSPDFGVSPNIGFQFSPVLSRHLVQQ